MTLRLDKVFDISDNLGTRYHKNIQLIHTKENLIDYLESQDLDNIPLKSLRLENELLKKKLKKFT